MTANGASALARVRKICFALRGLAAMVGPADLK